jgi:hypothetical protein
MNNPGINNNSFYINLDKDYFPYQKEKTAGLKIYEKPIGSLTFNIETDKEGNKTYILEGNDNVILTQEEFDNLVKLLTDDQDEEE